MERLGPTALDSFAKGRWGGFVEAEQAREVAQRFREDLKQLRKLAGQPSYSTLERLSGHELKPSTMSDVLNGNRVNLPDWRLTHEFVVACRAAARENGLEPNELGTVAEWKRHWDGALDGVLDASLPGRGGRSAARQGSAPAPRQAAAVPMETPEPPGDDLSAEAPRPLAWGPVPPRLPDFVGREPWLEALRQALKRDDRVGVIAIQGALGVGKTQLAIEYAYRHASEYDLVWWVSCGDADRTQGAMADLAARVGVAEVAQEGGGNDYTELFDLLRRRQRFARWLLIFDNVEEPEDIKDLIQPLSGDVLVTTRSNRWEMWGELLELDVFDRGESVEFLRRRMRKFASSAAYRLAEGVGDLPLLLEHAVESRIPVNAYLARLDSEPLRLLDEHPADYHATIASVWRTAVDQLRVDAPDALALLRCLAYFGADPVPRESLDRGGYLVDVSIHAMLREPLRLAAAIGRLRRAGLLRMRPGTSLAVPRVTRCVVRDLIAKSDDVSAERIRHDVHALLAAADPHTPDDPATWLNYEELRAHVDACHIVSCPDELVRRFVVNLVRYLIAAGDPSAAVAMADSALARWDSETPDSSPTAVDCRLAMLMAKADALFADGELSAAFQLRQEALTVMRTDPGSWSAKIIDLEGTSGARFRVTGNFAAALAADEDSARAHYAEFGSDDPRTFHAVNTLVADLALNGDGAKAIANADSVYRNCMAFYGDAGHAAVLAARNVSGRCRWLAGTYDEAAGILAEVHRGYDELAASRMLDENHPWLLVHEIDHAIARRDMAVTDEDFTGLASDMQGVHRRCWRIFGRDHPQTLAATVVLASILRRIDGQVGEAVRLLGEAERRYQSMLPGHPYCHACAGFLATVRCQSKNGSAHWAATQTVPALRVVTEQLADSLGKSHPLSLTATAALANALARAGELDAALQRGREARSGLGDVLGPDHPHTLILDKNIEAMGSGSVLGRDTGQAALARRRLQDIDFTPLPL